ncbi:MAG: hypothetical protein Q8Q97_00955 [bacterium]|nr:hypothetical protein [bacterium]
MAVRGFLFSENRSGVEVKLASLGETKFTLKMFWRSVTGKELYKTVVVELIRSQAAPFELTTFKYAKARRYIPGGMRKWEGVIWSVDFKQVRDKIADIHMIAWLPNGVIQELRSNGVLDIVLVLDYRPDDAEGTISLEHQFSIKDIQKQSPLFPTPKES